jgi:hypothetical protein
MMTKNDPLYITKVANGFILSSIEDSTNRVPKDSVVFSNRDRELMILFIENHFPDDEECATFQMDIHDMSVDSLQTILLGE